MTRIHFTHEYLVNPQHPITVNLIGAGGTGSQVLTLLARMDAALRGLGKPGLYVKVYDPDVVAPSNIGRQMFYPSDIGLPKSDCLVSRINAGLGTDWVAEQRIFPEWIRSFREDDLANIYITCTDNTDSRFTLDRLLDQVAENTKKSHDDHRKPYYWFDMGNARTTGQAIVGTIPQAIKQQSSKKFETVGSLPRVTALDGYGNASATDNGPSCSLAEALHQQDLFINSIIAQHGVHLLWKMLRDGLTAFHGVYVNLDTLTVNPVPV